MESNDVKDARFPKKNECLPLYSIEEVLSWSPKCFTHITLPIFPTVKQKEGAHSKVLVCHDMKGGYLEDRHVHGICKSECFTFIHWQFVDIFVYFSHSFITIPPCSWINAAHRNGILILGTLITEHESGASNCRSIFGSLSLVNQFCNQLVLIAVTHGFDGWLINIENNLKAQEIPFFNEFLRILTKRMHHAVKNSVVIWYDSVTESGDLSWQNTLNEKNKCFFDVCDGIYLNYNWTQEHLKKTVKMAESRSTDVYAGIDVFGRGTLGGGGFNTILLVRMARTFGLSLAIFAPGWIYENFEPKECLQMSYKFWNPLRLSSGHRYNTFPFSTTFCPGFGDQMFRKGKVVRSKPWYNLGLQQIQPIFQGKGGTELCVSDAYSGGGCLKLMKLPGDLKSAQTFLLFSTHFVIEKTCSVRFLLKQVEEPKVDFDLILSMSSFDKNYTLCLSSRDQRSQNSLKELVPVYESVQVCFPVISTAETLAEDADSCGWVSRSYLLPMDEFRNHVICSVEAKVTTNSESATVYLGSLELKFVEQNIDFRCSEHNSYTMEDILWLQLTMKWNKPTNVDCVDIYYKLDEEEIYINTTTQEFLYIELNLGQVKKPVVTFLLYAQGIHFLLCNKLGSFAINA